MSLNHCPCYPPVCLFMRTETVLISWGIQGLIMLHSSEVTFSDFTVAAEKSLSVSHHVHNTSGCSGKTGNPNGLFTFLTFSHREQQISLQQTCSPPGNHGPPQPPEDSRAANLSFLSAGLLSYYRLYYFKNIVIIYGTHLAGEVSHSHTAVSVTHWPFIYHWHQDCTTGHIPITQ